MIDYQIAKNGVSDLPRYYLGQEVKTPIGDGILISLSLPSNGLYLSPERAECMVWFGTGNAKEGWVQKTFKLTEISGKEE